MRVTCRRWINRTLLTTSILTRLGGHHCWRQNIESRREAGRLAILKYVTHVAVSERTFVCATKFCLPTN
jgi:hypothetical protein